MFPTHARIALRVGYCGNANAAHKQRRASSDEPAAMDGPKAATLPLMHCQELHYSRGAAYALRGIAAVANAQGDPRIALETLERC